MFDFPNQNPFPFLSQTQWLAIKTIHPSVVSIVHCYLMRPLIGIITLSYCYLLLHRQVLKMVAMFKYITIQASSKTVSQLCVCVCAKVVEIWKSLDNRSSSSNSNKQAGWLGFFVVILLLERSLPHPPAWTPVGQSRLTCGYSRWPHTPTCSSSGLFDDDENTCHSDRMV